MLRDLFVLDPEQGELLHDVLLVLVQQGVVRVEVLAVFLEDRRQVVRRLLLRRALLALPDDLVADVLDLRVELSLPQVPPDRHPRALAGTGLLLRVKVREELVAVEHEVRVELLSALLER